MAVTDRRLPLEVFSHNKVAGALVLIGATLLALLWANSPWSASYHSILHTPIHLGVADFVIQKSVHVWISDGLMGVFFFVVGLEIKREALAGELSSMRKAALPLAGAVGGMLIPALLYSAFTAGTSASHGWGIPMATDIAFALGVLLLMGPRVPVGLKVFLVGLAIVDDIGAILIIALFYTEKISPMSLLIAASLLGLSIFANRAGVRSAGVYFVIGTGVWLAFLSSGVHATLASVLMALTIPARTRIDGQRLVDSAGGLLSHVDGIGRRPSVSLLSSKQQQALQQLRKLIQDASAPLQELEHNLVPLVTFLVLPLFALANAGVPLDAKTLASLGEPLSLGIIVGLFVGKQLGIVGACFMAIKLRIAEMPREVSWRDLHAVAILGGIGFTMSLFVTGLAFNDPAFQMSARVGILAASTVSALVGGLLLKRSQWPASSTI